MSALSMMAFPHISWPQDDQRFGLYKRQLILKCTALKVIRQRVQNKGPYLDCRDLADCHIRVLSPLPLDCKDEADDELRFYKSMCSDRFDKLFDHKPVVPWCWPEDSDPSLEIGGWIGDGKKTAREFARASNTSTYISHFFDYRPWENVTRLAHFSSWGGLLSVCRQYPSVHADDLQTRT